MNEFSASDDSAELKRLRFALQSAQIGTWTLDIVQQQVWWDATCKELYGFRQEDVVPYDKVLSYMHDEDRQRVNEAVQWALDPQSGGHYDIQFRTVGAENGQVRWLHCRGQAEFDGSSIAYLFAGTAQNVTQQVLSQQASQESEARFRSLIEEAPIATCLFVGRSLRIDLANEAMIQVWGKGPNVIGLPLAEALPELKEQHFLTTIDNLFTTGDSLSVKGGQADLVINGQLQVFYFDYDFKPLRDQRGDVYAILETATDVTRQVLDRRSLETSEAALQNAIKLAELGTWTVTVETGTVQFSQRQADIFGLSGTVMPYEQVLSLVHSDDFERVKMAFLAAMELGSAGSYEAEYRITNARTGELQTIRSRGETSFDEQGQPVRITGTTQDITREREIQATLEQQVQQRTEELVQINEELAASNEEYAVINEELEEANDLLNRSNSNLQTFAYVASHDLQEPLRKIQQFGDLLKTRFIESVGGEELIYIDRMRLAASRMSALIKDLLNFSRISTQRNADDWVALNTIIDDVLSVLDMVIAETDAQIHVDQLPIISGDVAQLGQLFQNLISNALKFYRPGVAPQIYISSQLMAIAELPSAISPMRRASHYHRIEVTDNGIGFDEKYLDRIFQVFQRLHGKSQYAGTGVGLAICEKVVANHGGLITAISQPGQGATFLVYLPAEI